MENRRIDEFLHLCCRVCLSVENVMVDTTDTVENFNKTIDELLFSNANMKRLNDTYQGHPKLICEECFSELLMVAKFREKCAMAEKTLLWLIKTTSSRQSVQLSANELKIEPAHESKAIAFASARNAHIDDENIELVECVTDGAIDDHAEYMFIENDETAAESDDARIELSSAEEFVQEVEEVESTKIQFYGNSTAKAVINHSCEHCGAGFAQANNLLRHMQTHKLAEDLTQSDLQSSLSLPNEIKRLTRDVTDESDASRVSTTNVMRKRKTSKKEHKCEYCSKSFCAQSLLLAHTRTHTNERPFECKTCSKTFKTRGALDLHTRRHSGVKPYRCAECDRAFVESSNLKVHMRTHTGEKPHQCTHCGRGFSRVFLLQIHQRTHTGERPYACDTCNRSFAQQSDLRAHIRIHSGERPHRCKVCGKGFIRSSGLTQHMRRHRKTDDSDDQGIAEERDPKEMMEAVELMEAVEATEMSRNGLSESTDGSNVIICYKTYNGYDETFTEYLKDDNLTAE